MKEVLLPLLKVAADHPHSQDINHIDTPGSEITGPYADYYRGVIFGDPVPTDILDVISDDFSQITDTVRYSIMRKAMSGAEDEVLAEKADILRSFFPELGSNDPDVAVQEPTDLRAIVDKVFVVRKLAHLNLTDLPVIDQDSVYEEITSLDCESDVTFDELIDLVDCFSPDGTPATALIEKFTQWLNDPEGGRKLIVGDDFSARVGPFVMGYEVDRNHITDEAVRAKAELYRSTRSYDQLVLLIEDLLFEGNAVGIELFEASEGLGQKGLLLESSEQILKAYGIALAKNGRTEDAAAMSLDKANKYEDYASIHLAIARYQRTNADNEAAIATLDALRNIDPILHFVHNSEPSDYSGHISSSPLGFLNERIAEEYARTGAYTQALSAFKDSRQYPEQTGPKMAQYAIEAANEADYLRAVLAFDATEHDTLFMISRLSIALSNKLAAIVPPGESIAQQYPEVTASLEELAVRLKSIKTVSGGDALVARVVDDSLMSIYGDIGSFDKAFEILEARNDYKGVSHPGQTIFGNLLVSMVAQGHYEDALLTFDELSPFFSGFHDFDHTPVNIALMTASLARGDTEVFYKYYHQLAEYKRSLALGRVLEDIRGERVKLDPEIAQLAMYGENSKYHRVSDSVAMLGRLLTGMGAISASYKHIVS